MYLLGWVVNGNDASIKRGRKSYVTDSCFLLTCAEYKIYASEYRIFVLLLFMLLINYFCFCYLKMKNLEVIIADGKTTTL